MQYYNIKAIICACSSRLFIHKGKVSDIAAIMKIKGYEVKLVPDLCKMVMQSSSELEEIASSVILACYPRAVRSLFRSHNLEPQKVVDIRNLSIEEICKQLDITSEDVQDTPVKKAFVSEVRTFPVETGTDAWYPVLDKERCCECEKCHDFCLFGVYSIEDGLVRVEQPQNCKNNCPACARICPAKAIIFPKYEKSPINGGLDDEELAHSLDTKKIYTDALRMRLDQRRARVSLLKKDDKWS